MSKELKEYRESLVETLRFLNESYDKLLITLSGGALGLSITFLKDVIELDNINAPKLLVSSWFLFILSLGCVLGRIGLGIEANRKAIKQVDEGTIYNETVGGWYSKLTRIFHVLAATSLVVGLLCTAIFINLNIGINDGKPKTSTGSTTETEQARAKAKP